MKSYSNDLPNDTTTYKAIVIILLVANLVLQIINLL